MSSESPDRQTKTEQNKERIPNLSRNYAPFLTMGFQLAAAVVVFLFIGHWCDKKFGIEPVRKTDRRRTGQVQGGFIKFFQTVTSITADEEKQRAKNEHEG